MASNRNGETSDVEDPQERQTQQQQQQQNKNLQTLLSLSTWILIFRLCWGILFLFGLTSCILSLSVHSVMISSPRGLATWQWSMIITALLAGPILNNVFVNLINLIFKNKPSLKLKAVYYIVELAESGLYVLWSSAILLAWVWVSEKPSYFNLTQEQRKQDLLHKFVKTKFIINITLVTIFIASILWLLKDLAIIMMKSTFHLRVFFDRVREICLHHLGMKLLTNNLLCLTIDVQVSDDESKDKCVDKTLKWMDLALACFNNPEEKKMARFDEHCESFSKIAKAKDMSLWQMNELMKEIKSAKFHYKDEEEDLMIDSIEKANEPRVLLVLIRSLFLHFREKINDKESKQINQRDETKRMFQWLETAGLKECLEKVFPDIIDDHSLQEKASRRDIPPNKFSYPKKSGLEDTENEILEIIRNYMVWIYKYHEAVVRALEDNEQLFIQLNRCLNLFLVLTTIILWLVMAKKDFRDVLVAIGSGIVASAFAFGDFIKKTLDTFSFVFLMHPFDFGDYCNINYYDNSTSVNTVKIVKVNLLTTEAITLDDEAVTLPNAELLNKGIINYTRSQPPINDSVVFLLDSFKKIDDLKDTIHKCIFEEQSRFWDKDYHLVLDKDDSGKIKATLYVKHKLNYYDPWERHERKSLLIEYLHSHFETSDDNTTNNAIPHKPDDTATSLPLND